MPAAAVDPIVGVPVPDEPGTTELAEVATGALAFDLDGDGVNELLGVVADAEAQGLLAVQAWWVADDGSVEPSNQVRARRSASVDEILSGRGRLGIDRDDMIAVRVDEPARLVVVQRDGRDVVLLATMGTETDQDVQCCFTVWELTVAERGQIDLRLVADPQRIGVEFAPVDVDGDGTDELLVTEGPLTDGGGDLLDVSLLRWTGERFVRDGFTIPVAASCCAAILDVGDTDGRPGEEVLLTGTDLATGLHRISSRGGIPHVERAEIGEVAAARAVDLPSGPGIVVADGFSSTVHVVVAERPAAGAPRVPDHRRSAGGHLRQRGGEPDPRHAKPPRPASCWCFPVTLASGRAQRPRLVVTRGLGPSVRRSAAIPTSTLRPSSACSPVAPRARPTRTRSAEVGWRPIPTPRSWRPPPAWPCSQAWSRWAGWAPTANGWGS